MNQRAKTQPEVEPETRSRAIIAALRHHLGADVIGEVRVFGPKTVCPKAKPGRYICLAALNDVIVMTSCEASLLPADSTNPARTIGSSQTMHLSVNGQDPRAILTQIITCLTTNVRNFVVSNRSACPLAKLPTPQEVHYVGEEVIDLPSHLRTVYEFVLSLEHLDHSAITGKPEFTVPKFDKHFNSRPVQAYNMVKFWYLEPLIALEERGLVEIQDSTLLVRRVRLTEQDNINLGLPPPPNPDDELVERLTRNPRRIPDGPPPEENNEPQTSRQITRALARFKKGGATMSNPRGSRRAARSSPSPTRQKTPPTTSGHPWPPNPFKEPVEVKPEASEAYEALHLIANRKRGEFTISGPDSALERWAKDNKAHPWRILQGFKQLREQGIVRVIDPRRPFFTVVVYDVKLQVIKPAPAAAESKAKATDQLTWPPNPFKEPVEVKPEASEAYKTLRKMVKEAEGDAVIRSPKRGLERYAKKHGLMATRLQRGLKQLLAQGVAIVVDKRRRNFAIVLYDVRLQTTEPLPRTHKGKAKSQRQILIDQLDRGEVDSYLPQFAKPLAPLGKLGPQVWAIILDIIKDENGQIVRERNPVADLVSKAIRLSQGRGIPRGAVIRIISELRQLEVLTPLNPDKRHYYDFVVANARFQEPAMSPTPPATNTSGQQLLWLVVASPVPLAEVARRLAKGKQPVLVLGGTAFDSLGLDLQALQAILAPKDSGQE